MLHPKVYMVSVVDIVSKIIMPALGGHGQGAIVCRMTRLWHPYIISSFSIFQFFEIQVQDSMMFSF